MNTHVMIDIETLSTRADAAIASIGAVVFEPSPTPPESFEQEFYQTIDLQSSMDSGGRVDGDTISWWMRQSEEARRPLMKCGVRLAKALQELTEFLAPFEDLWLWSYGANFDGVILREAYARLCMEAPWTYRQEMCFRTLIRVAPPELNARPEGPHTPHNALSDARQQASLCAPMLYWAGGLSTTNKEQQSRLNELSSRDIDTLASEDSELMDECVGCNLDTGPQPECPACCAFCG